MALSLFRIRANKENELRLRSKMKRLPQKMLTSHFFDFGCNCLRQFVVNTVEVTGNTLLILTRQNNLNHCRVLDAIRHVKRRGRAHFNELRGQELDSTC
ncbi:hypothetical protein EJ08DRAFT_650564 [Tothia fuscella]|uniref:Uncharacterized protein n=1 Tax=Tothia fuscella TaxID=1048955 RepID=A0A9P4NP79_9PEZI|nr:hypothetical protein EJ08DRAFT_650564 [Tothia fuscella]